MDTLIFCQSCGMPITDAEVKGTNKDGTASDEYCTYCYQDGTFTQDITMMEMIEHCTEFVGDANDETEYKISKEQATAQMMKFFPMLKRWKK